MGLQTVLRAAKEEGQALALRHYQKWSKYRDQFLVEGMKFCPVIFLAQGDR